jgi:rsbT co-antagonist protein RsbR
MRSFFRARSSPELEELRGQLETANRSLDETRQMLDSFLQLTSDMVSRYDLAEQRQVTVNRQITDLVGYTPEQSRKMTAAEVSALIHPDDRQTVDQSLEQMRDMGEGAVISFEQRVRHANGTWRWLQQRATPFSRNPDGSVREVLSIIRDITEEKESRQDRAEWQERVIAAQQETLRELSTPLIPIAEGVVAMPLIGSIDSNRARQMLDTLLGGVSSLRAEIAILDITGVPVVDSQVADTILQAAQAVQLLGARVVLTGIRPEVAQTLVNLGASLNNIVTRSDLQSGIAYALNKTE